MFICNIKINSKNVVKIALVVMAIIVTIFFLISVYKILSENFKIKDNLKKPNVANIDVNNYTNILKCVYEDIDTYVGQIICFSGYVYRDVGFNDNQFVLARNMLTNSGEKTLVVGFLCNSSNAKDFQDNSWVEITGNITKGNFNGEIPIIEITDIKQIEKPNNEYVYPPDDTYIPTSIIFSSTATKK